MVSVEFLKKAWQHYFPCMSYGGLSYQSIQYLRLLTDSVSHWNDKALLNSPYRDTWINLQVLNLDEGSGVIGFPAFSWYTLYLKHTEIYIKKSVHRYIISLQKVCVQKRNLHMDTDFKNNLENDKKKYISRKR